MSKSTVQRRFREYEISVSSAMSQLTNDQLDDLVRQIKTDFSNAGYRCVDSQQIQRWQGIKVSQSRVREVMQRVDPEGVTQRWLAVTWPNSQKLPRHIEQYVSELYNQLVRYNDEPVSSAEAWICRPYSIPGSLNVVKDSIRGRSHSVWNEPFNLTVIHSFCNLPRN